MTAAPNTTNDNEHDDDLDSVSTVSDILEDSGAGLSKSDEEDRTHDFKHVQAYKPRRLTAEEKEKLVVEQAELLAFFTFLYSATALAIAVRLLTKEDEVEEFEKGFDTYSNELYHFSDFRLREAFSALLSVANQIASHAQQTGDSFPTVTIPNFDQMAELGLERTILQGIRWNPIVKTDQLDEWCNYTNQDKTLITITDASLPFLPTWQYAPQGALREEYAAGTINLIDEPYYAKAIKDITTLEKAAFTSPKDLSFAWNVVPVEVPSSLLVVPVFSPIHDGEGNNEIVGYLDGVMNWNDVFADNLDDSVGDISLQLHDDCGEYHRFLVQGQNSAYDGTGEIRRRDFGDMPELFRVNSMGTFDLGLNLTDAASASVCIPTITMYATKDFRESYHDGDSMLYTSLVLVVFFVSSLIFSCYFCMVRRRHARLESTVEKTAKIVTNVFPGDAGKRILAQAKEYQPHRSFGPKAELKQLFGADRSILDKNDPISVKEGKPIADLFPSCTIVFADIVGFTAWSSTREPSQVFTLLESIYAAFDSVAYKRRVFKVETVGDCYVAVCGLPDPRKDHAVAMARFSGDILFKFSSLAKQLETALGPGTAELGLRIGMHSGPVTAGVLRGERARFQLFGDTMNTAARMESTGERNRIHLSQDAVELLSSAGKAHWCIPRKDSVFAKGKGELQTYWLQRHPGTSRSFESDHSSEMACSTAGHSHGADENITQVTVQERRQSEQMANERLARLIDWNTDLLLSQLKEIVTERMATESVPDPVDDILDLEMETLSRSGTVLEEVQDIIRLPRFVARRKHVTGLKVEISEQVRRELRDYVATLSALYRGNAFHNFEHASHVTQSVDKLFSRIIAPDITADEKADANSILHDHTYGISSASISRFAVYLSALIHDTDHPGVPNAQLCKEESPTAKAYSFKSVAEQNSVELAWKLLMKDSYSTLRRTIYTTKQEFHLFRQLVVNTVMATDIMDKTLGQARKNRWNMAFEENVAESVTTATNRKATIVIEHLIQASDVAHTMQHWHVYRKWNKRLFFEMYQAWLDGRSETNPADNWYKGELGFFDFYIIPLAKKLADCGVFGVSSDEYLNYAQKNRAEWEHKGQQIVADLVEQAKYLQSTKASVSSPSGSVADCGKDSSSDTHSTHQSSCSLHPASVTIDAMERMTKQASIRQIFL